MQNVKKIVKISRSKFENFVGYPRCPLEPFGLAKE